MPGEMTIAGILWFLDLFDELGVKAWLDGGWGVDALLGEQTRPHADIDIMVPVTDSPRLVNALFERGFEDVYTDDRVPENFVMGHAVHGQVDFHVFELAEDGSGLYKPGVEDWEISVEELAGSGSIGGRPVRCLSPEYLVRSHVGYPLKASDAHDMAALRERFGVKLLNEQLLAIEEAARGQL